jgi:hypothetical protein
VKNNVKELRGRLFTYIGLIRGLAILNCFNEVTLSNVEFKIKFCVIAVNFKRS